MAISGDTSSRLARTINSRSSTKSLYDCCTSGLMAWVNTGPVRGVDGYENPREDGGKAW
jgi:hypothetical protein